MREVLSYMNANYFFTFQFINVKISIYLRFNVGIYENEQINKTLCILRLLIFLKRQLILLVNHIFQLVTMKSAFYGNKTYGNQ